MSHAWHYPGVRGKKPTLEDLTETCWHRKCIWDLAAAAKLVTLSWLTLPHTFHPIKPLFQLLRAFPELRPPEAAILHSRESVPHRAFVEILSRKLRCYCKEATYWKG